MCATAVARRRCSMSIATTSSRRHSAVLADRSDLRALFRQARRIACRLAFGPDQRVEQVEQALVLRAAETLFDRIVNGAALRGEFLDQRQPGRADGELGATPVALHLVAGDELAPLQCLDDAREARRQDRGTVGELG